MKAILPWCNESYAWVRYHLSQDDIALGTIHWAPRKKGYYIWKAYPALDACDESLVLNGDSPTLDQAKSECDKALKSLGWQFIPNKFMALK